MKEKLKAQLVAYREDLFEDADDQLRELERFKITSDQRHDILRYLINAHLEIAEALSELINETDLRIIH